MHTLVTVVALVAMAATGCRATAPDARDPRPVATVASDTALRAELLRMAAEDQEAREGIGEALARRDTVFMIAMLHGDSARTRRLRGIVREHGWPAPARVGEDGVRAAWLVLQHTADTDLMRELLPALVAAAERGEVARASVAMLDDRVRVRDGRPQRYGSQFSMVDGRLVPAAIEDLPGLDARRVGVGLPPMAEYVRTLEEGYGALVTWPPSP